MWVVQVAALKLLLCRGFEKNMNYLQDTLKIDQVIPHATVIMRHVLRFH
jgi:hypothetical protein